MGDDGKCNPVLGPGRSSVHGCSRGLATVSWYRRVHGMRTILMQRRKQKKVSEYSM